MRTVLVLGASSDIGLAICRRYLDAGWRVLGHYRTRRPELDGLAGPAFEAWACDLADASGLEAALAARPAWFASADAFVNLAASAEPSTFGDFDAEALQHALTVNLLPGLLVMRAVSGGMLERGWGRVVQASSIGVKFGGGSNSLCYSLSKHALEFIPAECRSWAARGVLVNVARVGLVDTRIHARLGKDLERRVALVPARRMAAPAEIAEALFWMGSEQNTYMSGQVVAVSGGE